MSTPAIDVVLPVREGRWLGPAVDTLLAQRGVRPRLVVVDDGADAAGRAVLGAHAGDPRVQVVRSPAPRGLAAALNLGLAHCRTDLVARADADDVYHPDRLARQAAAFAARPALGVLSTGHRSIDAGGRVLGTHRPPTGPALLRFLTVLHNPLLHPGVMFRAGVVRAAGGYDERFWTAQDTDLWQRLAARTQLDNLPDVLVDWRRHDATISASRGPAGADLSLEVSLRAHEAYLGGPLDPEAVRAAVAISRYQGRLDAPALRAGEAMLRRLARAAERREPPEVRAHFRRASAAALRRQARLNLPRRPALAAWALSRALGWRGGARGEVVAAMARA